MSCIIPGLPVISYFACSCEMAENASDKVDTSEDEMEDAVVQLEEDDK